MLSKSERRMKKAPFIGICDDRKRTDNDDLQREGEWGDEYFRI
jgi:hypothetical protein